MPDKVGVIEFGRQLIETGDLDPVYVALWKAKLEPEKLKKFLLSYFCFYHCGTASWVADSASYWNTLEVAAASSKYPRGTERRHFRGAAAVNSVDWLRERGIDSLFDSLMPRDGYGSKWLSLKYVMDYVKTWKEFGPWIAFKVADMLERLAICEVRFDDADCFLFDSPKEGASLVFERYAPDAGYLVEDAETPEQWAMKYIQQELSDLKAPPRYERPINAQEVETILCKWKSYLGGHYHVGKDIHEIRAGLLRFPTSPTAQMLLRNLPPVPSRSSVA